MTRPSNVTVVNHPLVQHKLTLMRDKNTPSAIFRKLLREISLLLGYEVLRDLPMSVITIETPLAAVTLWQAFIDSKPNKQELDAARAEMAKWKKLAEGGAEKIKGKWVGGDERKQILAQRELGWKPRYASWRQGLAQGLG